MSWLSYCYKTYQNSVSEIGKQQPGKVPLLPVAHTTQQVNIEVELDKDGNFQYAGLLTQDQRTTIIPCTEESSARTSGMVPHPLVDKLQYIAADYPTFGGSKESGWPLYHKQLQAWCTSPYAHPAVCTVLHYLEKECLIADLVKANILFIDENGTLPTKWQGNKEDKPPILDTLTGSDQTESFVRFRVDNVDLSRDTTVRESFIRFYETQLKDIDYCTVQGIKMPVSTLSPYKIRNPGDRAKLISSNDNTNYTYRGRFADAAQALSIGYETTQKAHSALRWLVSKQGVNTGDQTVLVWGTQNEAVPNVLGDTLDIAQEYTPKNCTAVQPGHSGVSAPVEGQFPNGGHDFGFCHTRSAIRPVLSGTAGLQVACQYKGLARYVPMAAGIPQCRGADGTGQKAQDQESCLCWCACPGGHCKSSLWRKSGCKAETSDNRTTDSLYYQWGALPAGFDDQRSRSGNKQHWPGLLGTTKNTKHCLRSCAWVLSQK